jgi:peptide/nickel transport system substrate-binding protein
MDEAIRAADDATRLQLTHEYLDLVAEQCVLYPVSHNETITAWDPKKLSGIKALPSPGVNLLQAKRA